MSLNSKTFLIPLLLSASALLAENPIIQTKFTADPAPMVWNDTVFLYTSHDEDNATGSGSFIMKNWMLYTSTDLVNWRDRGIVASLTDLKWGPQDNGAWAPQVVQRNGKFYMYVPLHGKGIGVLVSNSPYGPFTDPINKALVNADPWTYIDPTVYIDSDGQAYLYFGNPDAYWVKLNSDMTSYSGGITKITRLSTYQEGPWFYKHGSNYYLAFASTCCPEGIGYGMATSPTGPWTSKGSIMDGNSNSSGNHPGIIDFKDKSYVFGFNYARSKAVDPNTARERRSVCLAEMKYNTDGSIQKVPFWGAGMPSGAGVSQVGTLDPYVQVEAETIAWSQGLATESCGEGGMDVTSVNNGEYIKVKGVNFGTGASGFNARVASAASGGNIELRLDSAKGKLVGTVAVTGTGGAQTWTTKSCQVSGASGTHDLFLVFTGGSGDLFNFNWWKFTRTDALKSSESRWHGEGLRVETAGNRISVHSDRPLDRVELVSARGEAWDMGAGSALDLDVSHFRGGVYFLKVRSGADTEVRRILLDL
jgi:arabinoxylan arabinofuranohydrolase